MGTFRKKAQEQATPGKTLLLIENRTPRVVVLVAHHGEPTTRVRPGKDVRLVSQRVCSWLPLTATYPDGRVVDESDGTCRGQTWTIRDPAAG